MRFNKNQLEGGEDGIPFNCPEEYFSRIDTMVIEYHEIKGPFSWR